MSHVSLRCTAHKTQVLKSNVHDPSAAIQLCSRHHVFEVLSVIDGRNRPRDCDSVNVRAGKSAVPCAELVADFSDFLHPVGKQEKTFPIVVIRFGHVDTETIDVNVCQRSVRIGTSGKAKR